MTNQVQAQSQVLVVDDTIANRVLLKRILHLHGFAVLEAKDGREAVEIAIQERPVLILMDLSMPILDGFEATRQIKGHDQTKMIPIVAVSAHCGDSEQFSKALEAGCLDCLPKPIEFDKVTALLATL